MCSNTCMQNTSTYLYVSFFFFFFFFFFFCCYNKQNIRLLTESESQLTFIIDLPFSEAFPLLDVTIQLALLTDHIETCPPFCLLQVNLKLFTSLDIDNFVSGIFSKLMNLSRDKDSHLC